jgi:hypothetical protein
MENKSKNPREVAYIVEKSTFAVLDGLTEADIENEEEPLTLHSRKFSRFSFLIINQDKKAATANLNVKEMFGFLAKSRFAMQQEMLYRFNVTDAKEEEELPLAYTVTIASGSLKGRTPADVLLNDGEEGKKLLNNQYTFLKNNLAKYPKNKVQMDAIVNASQLLKEGKLDADAVGKGQTKRISLYSSGLRPLVNRKNNAGMSFVYELTVDWLLGEKRPLMITIVNYYAPVIKKDDGMLNVQVKQRDQTTLRNNTVNLTFEDWAYVQHMIETDIERFESGIYWNKRKESDRYFFENRKNAGVENR